MALALTQPTSSPRLAGRYSLIRCLGLGAHSAVFEAESPTGTPVAVKVFDRSTSARLSPDRLLEAAKRPGQFAHPNMARGIELGIDEQGRAYVVSELLHGETLADILALRGPLGPRDASRVTLQILAGLESAHARGLVHGNLKPSNVLVTRHGADDPEIKLLDFYTPRPEPVSSTRDLESVAAILYELLSGRAPDGTPLAELTPAIGSELADMVDAALGGGASPSPSFLGFAEALAELATSDEPEAPLPGQSPLPELPAEPCSEPPPLVRFTASELEDPEIPRAPAALRLDAEAWGLDPGTPLPVEEERHSRRELTLPPGRSAPASARSNRLALASVALAGFAGGLAVLWLGGAL
ncbi:MAG: protein kinase [Polyangiaceae bacterium]|nr:protein kinase [Polyangiaceae bacterium]